MPDTTPVLSEAAKDALHARAPNPQSASDAVNAYENAARSLPQGVFVPKTAQTSILLGIFERQNKYGVINWDGNFGANGAAPLTQVIAKAAIREFKYEEMLALIREYCELTTGQGMPPELTGPTFINGKVVADRKKYARENFNIGFLPPGVMQPNRLPLLLQAVDIDWEKNNTVTASSPPYLTFVSETVTPEKIDNLIGILRDEVGTLRETKLVESEYKIAADLKQKFFTRCNSKHDPVRTFGQFVAEIVNENPNLRPEAALGAAFAAIYQGRPGNEVIEGFAALVDKIASDFGLLPLTTSSAETIKFRGSVAKKARDESARTQAVLAKVKDVLSRG